MWESIWSRWQSVGLRLRPGATTSYINTFEQQYGVRLPNEAREFYTESDGMSPGEWDEEQLSFYPLAEVYPIPVALPTGHRGTPDYTGIGRSLPDAASYFVFADYSVRCHVYAVRLSADPAAPCPVVWIAGSDNWEFQVGSFGEFLRLYAEDPGQVLFPSARHAEPGAAPDPALKAGPGR